MNTTPPSKRLCRRGRRPLQHSFHVLTDGSEYSGHVTVFLSIEPTATTTIRYAITGLSGMIARLAADQKVPLLHTRAVFFPSVQSREGLASLLLALSQAGASQLTVCGGHGTCDYAHYMAHAIIPNASAHPKVITCQIEAEAEAAATPEKKSWFCIHEDDYLVVHAKSCATRTKKEAERPCSTIVLVYTLLIDEMTQTSFAVVPTTNEMDLLSPLPAFVGGEPLDFVLLLHGSSSSSTTTTTTTTTLQSSSMLTKRVLSVEPREWDDGLLIRAQHLSKQRHDQWPFLYPYNHDHSTTGVLSSCRNDECDVHVTTCTTWRLGNEHVDRDSFKREIWNRCRHHDDDININDDAKDIVSLPLSRNVFYDDDDDVVDENEIDLDDDNDNDDDNDDTSAQKDIFPSVPHFLVLGTGCASPSPQRGSSGYAVFLPSGDTNDGRRTATLHLKIVIECGEGYMTSLKRHLPFSTSTCLEHQLSQIFLIWISHAHLDHYAGLPCLLRAQREARSSSSSSRLGDEMQHKKRQRRSCVVPLVVAPQKVLQFLNATLDDSPNLFFQGMTHAEWECSQQQQQQRRHYPEMPFDYLHSVPVNHCPDAHGLLLRTSSSSCGQEEVVLLCYSGDCRPCGKLIRACRDYNPSNRLQLTLLLHEATFDDEESEMACSKRHCTVSEALGVARDMKKVDATLLTHFSQRYAAKAPKARRSTFALNDNNNNHDDDTINYGMCQDGLWLPLTKKALSNIYLLKHM